MSLLQRLVFPAVVGAAVAVSVLYWAPEWVMPKQAQSTTDDAPQVSETATDSAAPNPQAGLAPAPGEWSGPVSYARAVQMAAPSVVNIYTKKLVQTKVHPLLNDTFFKRFFSNLPQPKERIESSLGSGVILSTDGHIITNLHVINDADEIQIALHDGREAKATVLGTDPEADLAVLKTDLRPLTPMHLADSNEIAVGDVVLAIGNPFGVGQTVTMGIISATGRSQLGLNRLENYIQTDAAINPGNSGGALINAYGQLVGINSAIYSQSGGSEGIGFAIPANTAKRTVEDIEEYGTIMRGWLGIEVREANGDILQSLNLPAALTGLVVTGTNAAGPAEAAGLMQGDIILKMNNQPTLSSLRTMNMIAALRPGDEIDIEFMRQGEILRTRAVTGVRE